MSFLLDRTYPPSFRGAEFIYQSGEINAGRKTVIHEYPNKTFRKIEDLGKNLRTFSITGVITGFFYEDSKKALEDALNIKGIGVLVHPFLGNINVVCVGFTVSESVRRVGIATYNLNFAEAEEGIAPRSEDNNISKIANLYKDLYDFIKNDLNGQYIAEFARNILFAGQKLSDISDTLDLIGQTVSSLSLNNTDFLNTNNNFSKDVFKIASPSGDIGGNISDLISKFDGLSSDGQTRYDASLQLVGFGSGDQFTTFNSSQSIQRVNNTKLINATVDSLAFANLVDSVKDITYIDTDDLDQTAGKVSDTYESIINSDYNKFSNGLLDKLAELMTQSRMFFEQERLTVNKVVEVKTHQIPVAVLSYQYTGSTVDYDILLTLNNNFNPAVIEGDIKVLES